MTDDLRFTYRNRVVGLFDEILETQASALDAARDAVMAALAADRLIHAGGSGHSHLLAEEVFYRAGGIAAAQALLDPDLMLHKSAQRSTLLEREEGRAARILANYGVSAGDVVFIASNSGRNAYPIELALGAREIGATTIALTSTRHAQRVSSRHSSGKLLYEVADIVIDSCGPYGDTSLPISGRSIAMGPTSTLTGVFVLNAILAEAVAELAKRGIEPDVYQSANREGEGAEAAAEAILARWQPRIRGL
ncbi:MAG: SIS domain-containing protein [Hyphomicrobiales bacterium]|nr:SIS domain-containing protein [Hyphomicrobiales bacterium]